jgi:glutathione S-transferase
MSLQLFAHPFSSYCQKALIAFYENDTAFEWRLLSGQDDATAQEHASLWPLKRMPLLKDGTKVIVEASIIIEYLDEYYRGDARLMPQDPEVLLETRMLDRFFDNYVMTPMQKIVFDCIRHADIRDPYGVEEARRMLSTAYQWLDRRMALREWAVADCFSLADCAAAPSLFYADWVHPIPAELARARAYRSRLLARPSFARAVDEARPFRKFFPPGAPDRD